MDELEKIIKENRTLFNEGLMPDGHKERFLKKIAPKQKNKIRTISFLKLSISIAAVIIISLIITNIYISNKQIDTIIDVRNYSEYKEMTSLEQQIISLTDKMNETIKYETISNINSITVETIPLSEQLPKEISEKEKAIILKKYYQQKVNALKNMKTLLAEQLTETDIDTAIEIK